MSTIEWLMIAIPTLPLLAAALTAILGPKVLKEHSHWPVIAFIIGSFLCAALLMLSVNSAQRALDAQHDGTTAVAYEHVVRLWTWLDMTDAYQQAAVPAEAQAYTPPGGDYDLSIDVVLRIDALTSVMLCMVTFIASLVAIYAVGYMHGDRSYWRFFAYVGLFVFSMTMLVSVSNFILLFVFWEAVGACSYLLIGFWYEKPEAAAAGKKAFLVNRIGDFGFALALFLIWTTYGTLNFHDVNKDGTVGMQAGQSAEEVAVTGVLSASRISENNYVIGWTAFAICVLLMTGACGKSAQFPLHVWLPDAMEGPTPVSALIHAATMVTAGVYMVTRCTPLFMASPTAQLVVAIIGAFTALLAGLIALTQYDLKRVLAYSTVSQLGYMFLALGVGTLAGITGGMFHLFTHAFFKALLFLGAGSVMHAMHHVIDMRRFSGLRKIMPITHATFFLGCLALAGIVPFAGFWSKDAIVASVHDKIHELEHELEHRHAAEHGDHAHAAPAAAPSNRPQPVSTLSDSQLSTMITTYNVLYYSALLTAFLTAFYTFRAFFMTFYGPLVVPHEAHHPHESPAAMTWPLIILSVFATVIGAVLFLTHSFDNFLLHAPSLNLGWAADTVLPGEFHGLVAFTSTLVAVAGVVCALYLYLGERNEVGFLYRLMNFEWLTRVTDGTVVASLQKQPLIAAINRGARSVGLGWLAMLIGDALLLVILILSAPLLLGSFVSPYRLSYNKFYFDEIYNFTIVWPLRGLAYFAYWIDKNVIDGLVNLCGYVPQAFGGLMRSLQMGLMQFYALAMVLGVIVLLAARMLWAG